MKNLKKTLAVVLAFAMVLSMGLTSFAYTDVTAGTKVSEAVGILSNLGILTGFEDGTFRPDETVTRAQMAAIICRVLGYGDQAESSVGTTAFSDVAGDHWASGYINVAHAQQIINGYPDGTYRPENTVAYEEAIKMIVVALGYELAAQAKGGWSQGYLAIASGEGITRNANGTVGSAAARSTIAVLVYNSLEVRLMDQNTWTTAGDKDEYKKTDDTILSKYLEVQKWEGIVSQVPVAKFAQEGYTEDADQMMKLTGAVCKEYNAGKLEAIDETLTGEIDCSLVPEANTLAGKKVIAYVGEEEDEVTGNRMVYAIAEKQGANTSLTISASQLISSGANYTADGSIFYKKVGATKATEIDLEDAIAVSGNYGAMDTTGGRRVGTALEDYDTADLANLFTAGGTITFISNDANDKIDIIQVVAFEEEAVIEEVEAMDGVIDFTCYTGSIDTIDTEDEDVLYIVYKDGAIATVNDLAANDTVSIVDSSDFENDSLVVLYASSKTVTGSVDSFKTDSVTIGGEKYEISAEYSTTPSELNDREGIFFLNVDGQIAWAEADAASKGNYALVLAAGTTSGLNGGYVVEVVLADGTEATYTLHSKAEIVGVASVCASTCATDHTHNYYVDTEEEVYEYLVDGAVNESVTGAKMAADGTNAYRVCSDDLADFFYEIKVVDGKLRKLTPVAQDAGTAASTKEYDEENMSYGNVSFNDATVVFSSKVNDDSKVEADDIVVGKVADFFVDGEGGATIAGFDADSNDIAGLVLGYDLATTVPEDGAAVIISDEVATTEIDDVEAYIITGIQAGKSVTYTLCNEEGFDVEPDTLVPGDVILVGTADAEGVVADYKLIYDYAEGIGTVAAGHVADEIYYVAGNVDDDPAPTNSKFFIKDDSDDVVSGTYGSGVYVVADGIAMKDSANYTLVDFSDGADVPEVSRKSKGKSIFGSLTNYVSEVFVRYYDGKLVEVVVYRYDAP